MLLVDGILIMLQNIIFLYIKEGDMIPYAKVPTWSSTSASSYWCRHFCGFHAKTALFEQHGGMCVCDPGFTLSKESNCDIETETCAVKITAYSPSDESVALEAIVAVYLNNIPSIVNKAGHYMVDFSLTGIYVLFNFCSVSENIIFF